MTWGFSIFFHPLKTLRAHMRQHDLDSKGVLSLGEPCRFWGPQLIGTFPQQSGTATRDGLSGWVVPLHEGPLVTSCLRTQLTCFRFLRTPLINWWWIIIPDQGYHPSLLTKPCKKKAILRGSLSKFNMELKKLWKMIFRRNWSSTWVPCEILDLCSLQQEAKEEPGKHVGFVCWTHHCWLCS